MAFFFFFFSPCLAKSLPHCGHGNCSATWQNSCLLSADLKAKLDERTHNEWREISPRWVGGELHGRRNKGGVPLTTALVETNERFFLCDRVKQLFSKGAEKVCLLRTLTHLCVCVCAVQNRFSSCRFSGTTSKCVQPWWSETSSIS